jgi:hypothetical protein
VADYITWRVGEVIQAGTAEDAIELMNHLRDQALRLDRHLADPRHVWNRVETKE